jgi:hypothetical protein
MGKDGITEETVKIAVVEKRIDTFEDTCHTARGEIKAELASIKEELKEELKGITQVNTKILLAVNTLETKHKTYTAIFGAVAGYVGAHLPGIFK